MSQVLRTQLEQGVRALKLELAPAQIDLLMSFMDLLQKWNKVYNLTAVRDPLLQRQLHKLLRRWRHVLESLAERNDRKPHTFEVLHHLYRAPAVKRDLADVIFQAELLDECFDEAVVYDVTFGCQQRTLLIPKVIIYMIATHTKVDILLWYPEERQDKVFVVFIQRREYEHKRCDIRAGRKIKSSVANSPF